MSNNFKKGLLYFIGIYIFGLFVWYCMGIDLSKSTCTILCLIDVVITYTLLTM